ncbi:flavin monoamine oxidase family protein [Alkaliphilus hydrothermalis]|uniref:Monoamine oxidase n=1 Tax=Alkaliphilus hydrothermalis TaxID=1482730 RepID=A0ABS2NNU7_9FIRM|nr:NAD(P)/FAD-dependent oxidoreductase [Alkaliphilus hydrothermalis]MBM7614623.1 monoamine oxidase [Alkaliphilus hydrothermalis]
MDVLGPFQPLNPTKEERLQLLQYVLKENHRSEDFPNIVELLNPPADITSIAPPGSCKNIRVAVLGGGLAGLSAAFELRKLGFNITIFEAEECRVGGRVYTHYFDRKKGLYGELGPMRFSVAHQTTWHYIDLFGLNTRPFVQNEESTYIYVRGIRVRNNPEAVQRWIYPQFDLTPQEAQTPWPELEAKAFETYLLSLTPETRKEILQVKKAYSPEINLADALSAREIMEKEGLSEGAISMLSSINPFIGSFLDNSYFEQLAEIYPANFSYLYEINGGLSKLPEAFYNSLANDSPNEYGPQIPKDAIGKINFRFGHQVTGLKQWDEKKSVSVYFKSVGSQDFQEEVFDYVVCAIPFSNLRLLGLCPQFSSEKMQAIRLQNMSAAQKTVFLFSKQFWEEGPPEERIMGGGSTTDLVINSIWYNPHTTDFPAPQKPGVITASYNWTQDSVRLGNFKDDEIPEIVKRQVEKVHGLSPFYLDGIAIDHKTLQWNNHPWSLGGFTFYNPQQHRLFLWNSQQPEYSGRVFFAGEHVSVSRAWMQGALQTGMEAANSIAQSCRSCTPF